MTRFLKMVSLFDGIFRSSWARKVLDYPWLKYELGEKTVPEIGSLLAVPYNADGLARVKRIDVRAGARVVLLGQGCKSKTQPRNQLAAGDVDSLVSAFWAPSHKFPLLKESTTPTAYFDTVYLDWFIPERVVGLWDGWAVVTSNIVARRRLSEYHSEEAASTCELQILED